jgi:hypothetical protein
MMNGNNSKLGILANLAGIRIPKGIPKITVYEGDDVSQIIKDMEARGEIPENLPAGQISVIVHRIISPPNGEPNWERYIASGTNVQIAKKQALAREEALEEAIKAASM